MDSVEFNSEKLDYCLLLHSVDGPQFPCSSQVSVKFSR